MLFADLRNSTRLAAPSRRRRFAQLLNEVFAVLTDVLFEHGGMLDKFVGDGLVAVFGAPLPQPDHALRACRAALAMQARLAPLRARWSRPDLPPLEIGIGINTGSMIIGNMGSKERFSYTVIGEEAHLGARLEAANKDFRTRILISEATWRQVAGQLAARELDVVRVPRDRAAGAGLRAAGRAAAARAAGGARSGGSRARSRTTAPAVWRRPRSCSSSCWRARPATGRARSTLERCRERLADRREPRALGRRGARRAGRSVRAATQAGQPNQDHRAARAPPSGRQQQAGRRAALARSARAGRPTRQAPTQASADHQQQAGDPASGP